MGSTRLRPGEFGDPWLIDRHEGLHPTETRAQPRARWQFRVRYRDHSGRVRELAAAGATKGAARRALERRIEAKRHDLQASGVLTAESTLATLADEWLAEREHLGGLAVNTLAVYKSEVRRVIKPVFGRLRLTEASPARLHALLRQVEQTRSSRQSRTVLRQMLDYAISVGALNANPMTGAPKTQQRRSHRSKPRALSRRELATLRAAVADRRKRPTTRAVLPDLLEVMLATGTRIGEVLALRWQDVHLDADDPSVVVCGTLIEPRRDGAARLHRQAYTKGEDEHSLEPGREVLLTASAATLLRQRHDAVPFNSTDDPVFANRTGGWLWPNNVRTQLRRSVARHSELLDIHPHLFRATTATLVAEALGVEVAQEMLGHSNPVTTRQYYVAPKRRRIDARAALE